MGNYFNFYAFKQYVQVGFQYQCKNILCLVFQQKSILVQGKKKLATKEIEDLLNKTYVK